MKCSNCGAKLTCGCQKRTATDGKQCCQACVAGYNKKIKASENAGEDVLPMITDPSMAPEVHSVTIQR